MDLFEQVKPYTMTSVEALFALYTSVNYVLDREIPGDILECGVWRGGSALLAALIMKARKYARSPAISVRHISGYANPH